VAFNDFSHFAIFHIIVGLAKASSHLRQDAGRETRPAATGTVAFPGFTENVEESNFQNGSGRDKGVMPFILG
jgi:hypothetical protein